jgi:hypothetical protein
MSVLIKRLSEAVSSHIVSANVLEAEIAFLDTILHVVVVYIDVLRTFVMALSADELDRRFIVAVELDWIDVVAQISDLLQQSYEAGCLLGRVSEGDVLSFSCRCCDQLLLARLVTDCAAGKFEEIS